MKTKASKKTIDKANKLLEENKNISLYLNGKITVEELNKRGVKFDWT